MQTSSLVGLAGEQLQLLDHGPQRKRRQEGQAADHQHHEHHQEHEQRRGGGNGPGTSQRAARAVKPRMQIGCASTESITSFISRASMRLPRNSGVRPIIMPTRNTVSRAYWIRLIKPTPSPPNTQLSIICAMGTKPPMGISESCMALTEPVVAPVVVAMNRLVSAMPKRSSLPSILPPLWVADSSWSTPSRVNSGLPACSAK